MISRKPERTGKFDTSRNARTPSIASNQTMEVITVFNETVVNLQSDWNRGWTRSDDIRVIASRNPVGSTTIHAAEIVSQQTAVHVRCIMS